MKTYVNKADNTQVINKYFFRQLGAYAILIILLYILCFQVFPRLLQ
jgi:hypothetical protein